MGQEGRNNTTKQLWQDICSQINGRCIGKHARDGLIITVPHSSYSDPPQTAILLYDFRFRLGEYNQALMLSGLAIRMAQALKLNTEYSPDIMCTEGDSSSPSVAARESRRRLMWACYVLDAWTGSGPDQLTMLREGDIKIQLPCNERNFGLRIPSVTETLGVGHVLQFLPPAAVPPKPAGNMGIMAYYIRIVTLWKRIVKYINNPDAGPCPGPWLPESEFASLDSDMSLWRRELPDFVEYSPDTIYARLDSNQLGGLMLIHCTYHHNYLELYKVSMPELFRPRATSASSSFPPEHSEMLQALQADCYFHARQISRLVAEAAEHGARLLSDSLLPFFLYDSSRVMLYYVARLLDPERVDAAERVGEAVQAVQANVGLLRTMAPLFPVSGSFVSLPYPRGMGIAVLTVLGCYRGAVAAQVPAGISRCSRGCPSIGGHDKYSRHRDVSSFLYLQLRITKYAHGTDYLSKVLLRQHDPGQGRLRIRPRTHHIPPPLPHLPRQRTRLRPPLLPQPTHKLDARQREHRRQQQPILPVRSHRRMGPRQRGAPARRLEPADDHASWFDFLDDDNHHCGGGRGEQEGGDL